MSQIPDLFAKSVLDEQALRDVQEVRNALKHFEFYKSETNGRIKLKAMYLSKDKTKELVACLTDMRLAEKIHFKIWERDEGKTIVIAQEVALCLIEDGYIDCSADILKIIEENVQMEWAKDENLPKPIFVKT